jgi:hypothetical protein
MLKIMRITNLEKSQRNLISDAAHVPRAKNPGHLLAEERKGL